MTRSVTSRRLSRALAGLAGLSLVLAASPPASAFFGYFGAFVPQTGDPALGNHTMPPFPLVPTVPMVPTVLPVPTIPPPAPQNSLPKTIISPPVSPHPALASAPEPATLLTGVLGAGLAGVVAWRRRRKARRGPGMILQC